MIYKEYEDRTKALKIRPDDRIRAEIFEGFDEFVGTKAQIKAEEQAREDRVKQAIQEERQKYADAYSKITSEFVKGLSEEYGTGIEEVDDRVYGISYERGHSGGFSDIESVYMDLVEIADVAVEAGKRIGAAEPLEDRR